jgi:phosphoribosyl 1,2-cyclic phosphodiesterase
MSRNSKKTIPASSRWGRGFKVIRPLASSSEGNAYLIQDGRSPLLLDCGLPVAQLKQATGYRLTGLAGCLITHEHMDHAKAAPDLMRAGINCYMSAGTAEALGLNGHRVMVVKALEQFTLGAWTVLPFEAIHDAREPLGFLLATRGAKLLYLTDSAYCKYRFNGLTHILIECNHSWDILQANVESGAVPAEMKKRIIRSHMSLDTVKDFFRANDLSQVRDIHLIHLSDGNSDAERFKSEIQALTGKPVYVADK